MLATTLLACLALSVPQQPAQEKQPPNLVAALPGDATLVLAIEDFATFWDRARRSDWGALASEPVLAPMWAKLDTLFQGEIGDDDITFSSALDALQGVAYFSTSPGDDGEDTRGLLLRMRAGFPEVEAVLRAEFEGDREEVEHDGRSFWIKRAGHPESWEVFVPWSAGFAMIEEQGRENALAFAATLARRLEAGAADGALDARLSGKRPTDRATFEVHLDLGALIATSMQPYGEQDERMHAALQLADFGWGTCLFSVGAGSALEVDASLELPRAGLFPQLAARARSAPTGLARLAPAETIEVATLGYDVRGAWQSLLAWAAMEVPDFSEELTRSLTGLSVGVGVDLEHELFAQLSGEFGRLLVPLPEGQPALNGVTVSMLVGLLGSPGSAATSVYLVGLEDEQVVKQLVEKLIGMSDAADQLQEEEVAGHRLRFFEVPELPLDPSWAFVDDVLVVSTHRSAVRSVLLRAGDDTTPGWADARRTAALRGDGSACGSALADLTALTRVKLASPLAMMLGMAMELPERSDEPEAASLQEIAEALPGLVEQHIRGTARTTLAVDGRVLRYRFWTD